MRKLIFIIFSVVFINNGFACIEEENFCESYEFEEISVSEEEIEGVDENILNTKDSISRSYKIKWVEDYISD